MLTLKELQQARGGCRRDRAPTVEIDLAVAAVECRREYFNIVAGGGSTNWVGQILVALARQCNRCIICGRFRAHLITYQHLAQKQTYMGTVCGWQLLYWSRLSAVNHYGTIAK